MKKILLQLFFLCIFAQLHLCTIAQDSSHLRVSLLTCTPGEELYSTFGHTAIRVTDSTSLTDIVFNYGTFDFEDNGFYLKFIRGKLLYYLSTANFQDFKEEYQQTNRGITEQVLNLSPNEKINIQQALFNNLKEQNKYYKYDFFFDNCTTRPRDMIVKYKTDPIAFKPVMPVGTRFRQAIHQYLDKNNKKWSELGIDLLLGAKCDAVMTTTQSQFLPDNLMKALDSSNTDHSLVKSTTDLYTINNTNNNSFSFTPMMIFSGLFILIVLLSYSSNRRIVNFLVAFDMFFFLLIGIMGIVFLFMWLGTDHAMCKNNFNLLWALPTHAIMAFFIRSKRSWVKKYFIFNAIFLLLLILCWFILPQQMNNALLPIVFLLMYRSYRIYGS